MRGINAEARKPGEKAKTLEPTSRSGNGEPGEIHDWPRGLNYSWFPGF